MALRETPIFVVLGMHRGGTSALTRGLSVLGVRLGERLMPAVPDNNETGFWEDLDIFDLNERLLQALGSCWDSLRDVSPGDLRDDQRSALMLEAAVLLWAKTRGPGPFGFKDPRTSRLLPFWQEVFTNLRLRARYLIALRNPLSIAHSLAKRDGVAPEKTHLLWLQHMVAAIRLTMGAPRVVVDYDRLLADPRRELGRIATILGPPRSELDSDDAKTYCDEFLLTELRHAHFQRPALASAEGVPPLVREAYAWLDRLALDDIHPDDDALARAWSDLGVQLEMLAPHVAHVEAAHPAAPVPSARPLIRVDTGVALLHEAASTDEQAIAQLTVHGEELRRALSEAERALDERNRTILTQRQALEEAQASSAQLTAHGEDLRRELSAAKSALGEAERALGERDRTILAQQEALEEARSRLAIMEGSRSWRLTAPLREVARLIGPPRRRGLT